MKAFIKSRSSTTEFIVIIALAFGLPILRSFVSWNGGIHKIAFSDARLLRTSALEIVLGALTMLILRQRGWSWRDFNMHVTWKGSAAAIPVFFGTYFFAYSGFILASTVFDPHTLVVVHMNSQATIGVAVVTSIVNALYEEVFVTAYVINALEKYQGIWVAFLMSALIRMSYHVYQGPQAVTSILPMGFLYAAIYCRWKTIWPLVVAHAAIDIIAFSFAR